MRVISGSAKGRRLKKVPGDSTRPIMDRVKENLFNILGITVAGTRWLDLFAGTGQVGIEALSRGAASAVFIDSVGPAIRTIKANLAITELVAKAVVQQMDAFVYLREYAAVPFDMIYVAPPQFLNYWIDTLRIIDERAAMMLTAEGIVIVQIDPKEFELLTFGSLHLYDKRRYGNTMLCFYET